MAKKQITCSASECNRGAYAKGMCQLHHRRVLKHGTTDLPDRDWSRPVRPVRVEGSLAYITLTKGYEAIIDASDLPLVGDSNWIATVEDHTVYACRSERIDGVKRTIGMHRAIMGAVGNIRVDHVSGNGLDNRRCNLRFATPSQNQFNSRRPSSNTTGFKGVYLRKDTLRWQAHITAYGKRHTLGCYDTAEEAHAAYVKASKVRHGEFRRAG